MFELSKIIQNLEKKEKLEKAETKQEIKDIDNILIEESVK